MGAPNLFLLTYDICDAKRLRKVHKTLKAFGDALQYSVFLCELSPTQKQMLINDLTEIIHHHQDRILIANLGRREGRAPVAIETLGRQDIPDGEGPLVL